MCLPVQITCLHVRAGGVSVCVVFQPTVTQSTERKPPRAPAALGPSCVCTRVRKTQGAKTPSLSDWDPQNFVAQWSWVNISAQGPDSPSQRPDGSQKKSLTVDSCCIGTVSFESLSKHQSPPSERNTTSNALCNTKTIREKFETTNTRVVDARHGSHATP